MNLVNIDKFARRLGPDRILAAAIAALVLGGWAWGERIPVNDGLGWDGVIYGSLARDPRATVFGPGLDTYYVQRFLPSLAVHAGLAVTGQEFSNENIIRAFAILDAALGLASIWAAGRIAAALGLGPSGRCLALTALFINYYFLKFGVYYPVLTDSTTYLLTLLQFLFFLRRREVALVLTSVVGAFIWPTALTVGSLLAIFPRPADGGADEAAPTRWAALAASALASGGLALLIVYRLCRGGVGIAFGGDQPLRSVLPLSVVLAVATLAGGLVPLLDDRRLYAPRALLASLSRRGIALAGVAALAVRLGYSRFTDGTAQTPYGLMHRLWFTVLTSVAKPGISLLALLVFWGPAVWLLVFYWRAICREIHSMGPGLTLATLLGLLLAICTEPRGPQNILPMVFLVGIKAIEPRVPGRPVCLILVPASLLASRFWARINVAPFRGNPLVYPDQGYYMSLGPWMSLPSYLLQLPVALAIGVVLYAACSRGGTSAGGDASPG